MLSAVPSSTCRFQPSDYWCPGEAGRSSDRAARIDDSLRRVSDGSTQIAAKARGLVSQKKPHVTAGSRETF